MTEAWTELWSRKKLMIESRKKIRFALKNQLSVVIMRIENFSSHSTHSNL